MQLIGVDKNKQKKPVLQKPALLGHFYFFSERGYRINPVECVEQGNSNQKEKKCYRHDKKQNVEFTVPPKVHEKGRND